MRGVERRLERMVEGVFARAFRSSLRPIEIGRRLVREIDANRSVDVRGRVIVPNHFTVLVSEPDHANLADIHDALIRELCDAAREYAHDEGFHFVGPVSVELGVDSRLKTGRCTVEARMVEAPRGIGPGAVVLPNGERLPLTERAVTIGRLPECDITLADPNVSRRHAELRPSGDGWVIVDLGSTNGTRVNGTMVVGERRLADGDAITIGGAQLQFQAS